MVKLQPLFQGATLLSVAVAVSSSLIYAVVHHVAGLQHVTCFGGTFGLFGHWTVASKPFIEYQFQRDVAYIFGMDAKLTEVATAYQHIEVYAHRYFGHTLVIDGSLQICEKDEVNYHEMTAHVPLAYLKKAKKVLVIGGGDGGALLRLLEHSNVQEAHLVDIDMYAMRDIVANYFPYLYTAYTDARTKSYAYDGKLWVDEQLETAANRGTYDVIVLDSTDYGAAESLFTDEFFSNLKKLMSPESVLVANVDSPSWNLETVVAVQNQMSRLFTNTHIFQSHQPTFLSGHYSYVFCSDKIHPMRSPIDWDDWWAKNITTYYYNPDVHYASFVLPEFVRSALTQGSQLKDLPRGTAESSPFSQRDLVQSPPAFIVVPKEELEEGQEDEGTAREDDD